MRQQDSREMNAIMEPRQLLGMLDGEHQGRVRSRQVQICMTYIRAANPTAVMWGARSRAGNTAECQICLLAPPVSRPFQSTPSPELEIFQKNQH